MNTTNKNTTKLAESQFNPTVFLKAIGRIIDSSDNLAGLILSENGVLKQAPLEQCIALAKKSSIMNVKAVTRNGKTYLAGNGISLNSLPVKYFNN
jgi:hypothetical protein